MRFTSLAPVLILGLVLAGLVAAAIFFQRKMHEHETQPAAPAADNGKSATPAADPNSMPDDLVERERLAQAFPETLVNVNGIRYQILREGSGAKPVSGQRLTAHYRGRLLDGTVFDSSYASGRPFTFTLRAGQVIRGWDEMFADMRRGELRMIVIPYRYAYGLNGSPPKIPPRAPLIFEVELVDFN